MLNVFILVAILCFNTINQSPAQNQQTQEQTSSQKRIVDLPLSERKSEPPKIKLQEAMKIAESYIEKEKIDVSQHYLREAKLVYPNKESSESFWWFWWVKTDLVIGDYVEIAVSMDGKARRLPSM